MPYYHKKQQPNFLENIFISIGKGLWWLISWPFKKLFKIGGPKKFDKAENLRKWMEVEKLLESNDEIHAQQAVIRADKFFDNIMRQAGAKGDKFAEHLRSLEPKMSHETYQDLWEAHKLRNQISHEIEHKTTVSECKSALNKLRRGMNSLGAI